MIFLNLIPINTILRTIVFEKTIKHLVQMYVHRVSRVYHRGKCGVILILGRKHYFVND